MKPVQYHRVVYCRYSRVSATRCDDSTQL